MAEYRAARDAAAAKQAQKLHYNLKNELTFNWWKLAGERHGFLWNDQTSIFKQQNEFSFTKCSRGSGERRGATDPRDKIANKNIIFQI